MGNAEYRALQVGVGLVISLQLGREGFDIFLFTFIYLILMDGYRWVVNKLEPSK